MQIIPTDKVQIPLAGEATDLRITVNGFALFTESITVDWTLVGPTTEKSGRLTLPPNIINQWGTDDTVVEDWVLAQLGLSRAI